MSELNDKKVQVFKQTDQDEDLTPRIWENRDTQQKHYFVSFIDEVYLFPFGKPRDYAQKIVCRPSFAVKLPHRYYRVHTRDGSPVKGRWIDGEVREVMYDQEFILNRNQKKLL